MDKDSLIKWWRRGDTEAVITEDFLKSLGEIYTARIPKLEELFVIYEGIGARVACRLQDDAIEEISEDLAAIEDEWLTPGCDCLLAAWDEDDEEMTFQLVPPAEVLKWFSDADDD